ncbi:hypothetical protein BKA62DRAFT_353451 [Auriculariales sp. MPI-PUGE-AT-0066]|nr:hypothetical protein BKA62DRAFT_353451 [Auriculariales sp. MPI-PUGE-AT-0066]
MARPLETIALSLPRCRALLVLHAARVDVLERLLFFNVAQWAQRWQSTLNNGFARISSAAGLRVAAWCRFRLPWRTTVGYLPSTRQFDFRVTLSDILSWDSLVIQRMWACPGCPRLAIFFHNGQVSLSDPEVVRINARVPR